MNEPWPAHLVAVAEVVCPQGNKGEVKAVPLTGRLERFDGLGAVTAWLNGRERSLTLDSWRAWRQFVILKFAELASIDDAETIRGASICVRLEERAELPPDQYYHDDLLGLSVCGEDGREYGRVSSILTTGANDVLVATDETGREVLIPALKTVIIKVDMAARRLIFRALPGLLDL